MKYRVDDDNGDDKQGIPEDIQSLDQLIDKHANHLLDREYEDIARWLTFSTNQILELIDSIGNEELEKKLSNLIAVVIGATGKAVIDLKTENAMLLHDILYELQGDVDPELN